MENELVICLPCALKIIWSSEKQLGGRRGRSLLLIRRIIDMTALAEVGVDFRCWKDFISDRSKTVKDLLDLSKER